MLSQYHRSTVVYRTILAKFVSTTPDIIVVQPSCIRVYSRSLEPQCDIPISFTPILSTGAIVTSNSLDRIAVLTSNHQLKILEYDQNIKSIYDCDLSSKNVSDLNSIHLLAHPSQPVLIAHNSAGILHLISWKEDLSKAKHNKLEIKKVSVIGISFIISVRISIAVLYADGVLHIYGINPNNLTITLEQEHKYVLRESLVIGVIHGTIVASVGTISFHSSKQVQAKAIQVASKKFVCHAIINPNSILLADMVGTLYCLNIKYTEDEGLNTMYLELVGSIPKPTPHSMCLLSDDLVYINSIGGDHNLIRFIVPGSVTKIIKTVPNIGELTDMLLLPSHRLLVASHSALHLLDRMQVLQQYPYPGVQRLFSLKKHFSDTLDTYLLLVFVDGTSKLLLRREQELTETEVEIANQILFATNLECDNLILLVTTKGVLLLDSISLKTVEQLSKSITSTTSLIQNLIVVATGVTLFFLQIQQSRKLVQFQEIVWSCEISTLALHHSGQFLAIGDWNRTLTILSMSTFQPIKQLSFGCTQIAHIPRSIIFHRFRSMGPEYLFSGLANGTVYCFLFQSSGILNQLSKNSLGNICSSLMSFESSPGIRHIFVNSDQPTVIAEAGDLCSLSAIVDSSICTTSFKIAKGERLLILGNKEHLMINKWNENPSTAAVFDSDIVKMAYETNSNTIGVLLRESSVSNTPASLKVLDTTKFACVGSYSIPTTPTSVLSYSFNGNSYYAIGTTSNFLLLKINPKDDETKEATPKRKRLKRSTLTEVYSYPGGVVSMQLFGTNCILVAFGADIRLFGMHTLNCVPGFKTKSPVMQISSSAHNKIVVVANAEGEILWFKYMQENGSFLRILKKGSSKPIAAVQAINDSLCLVVANTLMLTDGQKILRQTGNLTNSISRIVFYNKLADTIFYVCGTRNGNIQLVRVPTTQCNKL